MRCFACFVLMTFDYFAKINLPR